MHAIKPVKPLYSMSYLGRALGVDRTRLTGLVHGLGIQTYQGPANSLVIDGDGLATLREALGLDLTFHRD